MLAKPAGESISGDSTIRTYEMTQSVCLWGAICVEVLSSPPIKVEQVRESGKDAIPEPKGLQGMVINMGCHRAEVGLPGVLSCPVLAWPGLLHICQIIPVLSWHISPILTCSIYYKSKQGLLLINILQDVQGLVQVVVCIMLQLSIWVAPRTFSPREGDCFRE